jgi:cellulase
MFKVIAKTALFAALVSPTSGHTAVEEIEVGGVTYPGFRGPSIDAPLKKSSPAWKTNQGWGWQPVMGDQIDGPDIIAHKDARPSPNTAEAPAGSNVTFRWHHEGICGEKEEGWDCSHHGWTATYLAPCNGNCSKVDKTQLLFFKIDQVSLIEYPRGTRYAKGAPQEQTGKWGTDAIFYDNNNTHTVTIPNEIPNGNYVLRTEVTSIHGNGDVANRQFWPQAFNIKVTGGDDNAEIPEGKKGTELYSADDELLKWDLYWHDANSVIEDAPGPQVAPVTLGINLEKTGSGAEDSRS